jgi:hypothetical protein
MTTSSGSVLHAAVVSRARSGRARRPSVRRSLPCASTRGSGNHAGSLRICAEQDCRALQRLVTPAAPIFKSRAPTEKERDPPCLHTAQPCIALVHPKRVRVPFGWWRRCCWAASSDSSPSLPY